MEQAEAEFTAERRLLIANEMARRQTVLDDRNEVLRQEHALLRQEWECASLTLDASSRPADMTPAAVHAAQASWQDRSAHAEARRAFVDQWLTFLQQDPDRLAARLPDYVNLVAATTGALPDDKHFGDGSANGKSGLAFFDLLILEEADQLTEAEFLKIAGRARRWILVGEPASDPKREKETNGQSLKPGSRIVSPATRLPSLGFSGANAFSRLWQHLHCDPRSLPYVWFNEQDRLCCRLREVAFDQRQWLETERVADFPDIELRILTLPHNRPLLAEIVFPPSMAISRAKQYIFEELQELAVRATCSSLFWMEKPDRLALRLADHEVPHEVDVVLGAGIRETLGAVAVEGNGRGIPPLAWQTCCVEFDRTAGWQRQRAEEWVQRHLSLRDLGRTVQLEENCPDGQAIPSRQGSGS
jgi:hypothetical protein